LIFDQESSFSLERDTLAQALLREFAIRSRDSTWIRLHSLFEFRNIHHSDLDTGNAVENHTILITVEKADLVVINLVPREIDCLMFNNGH
jgi:hypothetical protein